MIIPPVTEPFPAPPPNFALAPAPVSITPMPAEIASAVIRVMKHMSAVTLEKKAENTHENFMYVSVDQIFEQTSKACAEAGLIVNLMQVDAIFEQIQATGKTYNVATFTYLPVLIHEGGQTWHCPSDRRTVRILWRGATTSGAAHSFAMKQYLRGLCQIATGDKDADAEEQFPGPDELPREMQRKNTSRREAGKPPTSKFVPLTFGTRAEQFALDEVETAVADYLGTLDDKNQRARWRSANAAGLEVLNQYDKKLWLRVSRMVDDGVTAMRT